jgi:anti-sigma regulatory factor (Ser/Thr protein kinase)
MALVELRFPPSAAQVRTARLVVAAVARRAGMDDARLDEVRLAVGEACARAVRRSAAASCHYPVVVTVEDALPGLRVEVTDRAGPDDPVDPVVLALLQGLADAVEVVPAAQAPEGPGGGSGPVTGGLGRGGSATQMPGSTARLEWLPPLAAPGPAPLAPRRPPQGG